MAKRNVKVVSVCLTLSEGQAGVDLRHPAEQNERLGR